MSGSSGALGGVRVASWPHWYAPNLYLDLLYRALAPHGVEHVRSVPLEPDAYAGRERRADILHLHWAYPLWRRRGGRRSPSARTLRAAFDRLDRIRAHGVPLIWTVHNVVPHDGFRGRERDAFAALHELADLRLFHSRSALAEAEARFGAGRGDRIVVRHGNWDGATPPAAAPASVLRLEDLPRGPRILLCFGQVRPYKGFDVAIDAVRRLDPARYHLVIAGRGIGAEGRRLARRARGAGNVRLILEEIDQQRLADLLGIAHAVLLPYRSVTGSGVLLHALTAGRGVICTDLPFFRETLEAEPEAGVLVPEAKPDALTRGFEAFSASDAGVRGQAARRLADRFVWSEVVKPLVAWLRQTLEPKSRPQIPGRGEGSAGTP